MAAVEPIFSVTNLTKRFGGVQALGGVSLSVAPREFRAIIGPNGAGKSTFFNTITGVHAPDTGDIAYEGKRVTGRTAHALARLGIARTFQITSIFGDLTVMENVQVALFAHARDTWRLWRHARSQGLTRARELLAIVGIEAGAERIAGTLSHGDQKRLELAIALAGRPRLLLLDEPTAGMAAQERLQSIRLVRDIANELGLTVIFTEHDMAVVFAVATVVSVLHQGRLLAEGAPATVRANPEVQRVYLGEEG